MINSWRLKQVTRPILGILVLSFVFVCIHTAIKKGIKMNTVKLQWLEHLWDHRKLFETWVVRATEGKSWHQFKQQIAII